jgi:hypothetical protein
VQHAKCQLITAAELAHSFDPLTARLFRTCLFAACRAKFNPRQRRKGNSHAVESATSADCGFHGSGAVPRSTRSSAPRLHRSRSKQKQPEIRDLVGTLTPQYSAGVLAAHLNRLPRECTSGELLLSNRSRLSYHCRRPSEWVAAGA